MTDPLLIGAVERAVPALRRSAAGAVGTDPRGAPDEVVTAVCEAVLGLCEAVLHGGDGALTGPASRTAGYRAGRPSAPGAPGRWARLGELLHDDPPTMLGLAEQVAETTGFGAVAVTSAECDDWDLALPALLAAAVRNTHLPAVAALVRAGVFLHTAARSSPGPITVRAARFLAARQLPSGGFGSAALTADCAWALAETAAPGLTAAHPSLLRTVRLPAATYGAKE